MLSVFSPILKSLELANQEVSEPISFLEYIKEQGLKARGTATHISVQSYQDLDPLLKEKGWMVYRLGSRAESKGTHFGLIKLNPPAPCLKWHSPSEKGAGFLLQCCLPFLHKTAKDLRQLHRLTPKYLRPKHLTLHYGLDLRQRGIRHTSKTAHLMSAIG